MLTLAEARKILELSLSEYSRIRADYWASVYDAIEGYMSGSGSIAVPKNQMKQAMINAFGPTADTAWQDGGAELPLDEDALAIYNATQNSELGNIDALFERLKIARSETDNKKDLAVMEATARADGYAGTLDYLYSQIKLLATGNKMLTFTGISGKESCPECKRYYGQRHRAKWWVAHDAIPGSHSGFSCGGWRCLHILTDDSGQIYSL